MAGFALKIKSKSGQNIVKNLTPNSTIKELKEQLSQLSQIPANHLHVLSGFPPKILDISKDHILLSESGLCSGDTLILEEKITFADDVQPSKNTSDATVVEQSPAAENLGYPGILMKHVVPADNSCLFSSIYFVLNGKIDDTGEVAPWMRQLIAETVSKDPDNFCEAILGKPNNEYCKWILDNKSWGGAIELAILSNYYGIEIAVVDTINAIINRFGEDQCYPHRVFLLFDGIHYDPLFLEPVEGGDIQTIFPSDDERILKEAEQLALEAKSSRQYTDVNKFTLKCLVCDILMSGQTEAQQHAKSTGHMNFGEV